MSLAVQIKFDEASLKEAEHALLAIPGAFNRVMVRALNRGIDQAFTRYKRGIVSATTLKATAAGKSMSKKKATAAFLGAALAADPKRFPLGAFEAKQTRLTKTVRRKIARGLASRAGGLGVRYRIGRHYKLLEGGFIATAVGLKGGAKRSREDWHSSAAARRAEWAEAGKTASEIRKVSHRGVFKRRGRERLKIDERYGPSVWRVLVNEPELAERVPAEVSVDLNRLVNEQMGVELRRWAK